MSTYGELDPIVKNRIEFGFTAKSEYISSANMPTIAYPDQHINITLRYGSADNVIVPDTVKIKFNLDTESTDKTRSIVNNVSRALVKKGTHAWLNKN